MMVFGEVGERLLAHDIGHVVTLLSAGTLAYLGKGGGALVELPLARLATPECHGPMLPGHTTPSAATIQRCLACSEPGKKASIGDERRTAMGDFAVTDTSDMYAVHHVFRKTFGSAGELLGGVSQDDADRRELVGNFYDNVIRFLHVHHDGEEELIWPQLKERCPDKDAELIRSAEQHQAVVTLMEVASGTMEQWSQSGSAEDQVAAATAVAALDAALSPHLDEEEAVILPLCSRHISPEEWGQLPGHGLGHFDGDKVWLILGLIRENMTQELRDHMLANMPPPAVEMWTGMGESSFNALVAELRGGP